LIGSEHFFTDSDEGTDERELFTSFFKQFYQSKEEVPAGILSEFEIDDKQLIENLLSGKKGKAVHITVPRKGEKKLLIDMAVQNAKVALENYLSDKEKNGFDTTTLLKLQQLLNHENFPERIEAFDISNTGTSEIVASMVVYLNGAMCKEDYRRYRLRSLDMPNDYAAMQEVLYRRFRKTSEPGTFDKTKPEKVPDLIFLDGGRGHVSAVSEVLKKLGVTISVYGMVKDDKHQTRALISDTEEINISETPEIYRFIYGIQEEVHRFALEYNKKLRSKRYSHSALDDISGIGRQRKNALIKHFKSVAAIRKSTVDELMQAAGINRKTAESVYEYFNRIRASGDK
jgi:excinuclease ABC subunit C